MRKISLLVCLLLLIAQVGHADPLKIYILVGQSNMQGHGAERTMSYMLHDPATQPLYNKLMKDDGTPREFENIRIVAFSEAGKGNSNTKSGPLTMGYGSNLQSDNVAGPELAFGATMAELSGEPILLIKTAWGGKSLNTDFRSPSAGPYKLHPDKQALWDKHPQGAHGIPSEAKRPEWWAAKHKATGHYYRLMLQHVRETLADLKSAHPAYDPKEGYELAGLVWFQGWNDMCDGTTYPNSREPDGYAEYTTLMAHFIRDVRKDLKAPNLPVVIGVIGVGGDKATGGLANLRPAMAAPAAMEEFKGTVAAVETGQFWDHPMEALAGKAKAVQHRLGAAHVIGEDGFMEPRDTDVPGWQILGTPPQAERTWRFIAVNPTTEEEKKEPKEKKRFRGITLPDELTDWFKPDFDDAGWKQGKAPVGIGTWNQRNFPEVKRNTDWPEGEFLLARSEFTVDDLDKYEAFRIAVLARQGYHIYLNGTRIHQYIWWQDNPVYREIILNENEAKLLKPGKNILALYANVEYDRKSGEPFNTVDVFIEGITKDALEYVKSDANQMRLMQKEVTPEEAVIIQGMSNGGYHYLGSGKMLSQIGEAFAKAMFKLEK